MKQIIKYTNPKQQSCMIGFSSMYAHNEMDGKIDIFTAKQLMQQAAIESAEQQQALGLPAPPKQDLQPTQFIETICGASSGAVVKRNKEDLLIVGLEDGTLGVMSLSKANGQSYRRPIFMMQN